MTCTFDITPCVRVEIRGRSPTRADYDRANAGKRPADQLPLLPIDEGKLLDRFREFVTANDIHPLFLVSSGGGVHVAYYSPMDADMIDRWLGAQPDAREG